MTVAKGPDAKLALKLIEAAKAVETVGKHGRNDQQKYDYARAEDIADAAQKALLEANVLAEFSVLEAVETPIKSRQGSDGLIVKVTCELIVTDAETGESRRRTAIGTGSDFPGDKGIYKAMTGARKYAFIHLLGISIGDDPDEDRGQEGGRRGPPKPTGPKLDAARVNAIGQTIGKEGITYKQIDLLLGACGIDGLRAASGKALKERLESLTPDQANALEAEIVG